MKPNRRHELLRFISARALVNAEQLSPLERARLYEALSLVLPKPEAELAQRTAFHLRQAEDHQLQFKQLLK